MKGRVTEWKSIRTKLERYPKNNNILIALTKKIVPRRKLSLGNDFWGQMVGDSNIIPFFIWRVFKS
jgi:hypothetical protein